MWISALAGGDSLVSSVAGAAPAPSSYWMVSWRRNSPAAEPPTLTRSPRAARAPRRSASLSRERSMLTLRPLFCGTETRPARCCTMCVSSWPRTSRPDCEAASKRPGAKWMSVPRANAVAPTLLAAADPRWMRTSEKSCPKADSKRSLSAGASTSPPPEGRVRSLIVPLVSPPGPAFAWNAPWMPGWGTEPRMLAVA